MNKRSIMPILQERCQLCYNQIKKIQQKRQFAQGYLHDISFSVSSRVRLTESGVLQARHRILKPPIGITNDGF